MDNPIILILILCSFLLLTTCYGNAYNNISCKSAKCSLDSIEIESPFRIEGLHPHGCGLSPFTLSCAQNTTTIRLDGINRDLFVKNISYDTQTLTLVDPKNCVHEVFLNLNLSLTPFTYYNALHQYKYVNCSSQVVQLEPAVPCLSSSNHRVYVVEPSLSLLPGSCSTIKTAAIPFSYNPYLSGFSLKLTWPSTGVDMKSSRFEYDYRFLYAVSVIIGVVFIAGKMLYVSPSKYGGELDEEKEMIDKLLGEYQSVDVGV